MQLVGITCLRMLYGYSAFRDSRHHGTGLSGKMHGTRDRFGAFGERDHGWSLMILLLLATSNLNAYKARVMTKFGEIEGLWSRSTRGKLVEQYLGIPYAEPPIGDLRFRNPQPWNRSWNTSYDATKNESICIQADVNGNTFGSEDCLYLNVFVPRISEKEKTTKDKFPVLVFVNGGQYMKGSSDSHTYPPNYLMEQNVILVTMNYRINILGFFSTENKVSPGNYGIKDVLMSMRWIHENIESFHGDRNSVTLWGHSVGAAIVHTLAFTKKTEGLFHRYIIQSGSIFAPWNLNKKTWMRQKSLKAAKMLDCFPCEMEKNSQSLTEEEDEDIMRCMRSVDAQKFGSVIASFNGKTESHCPFGPTIEPESEDGILTVHPITATKNKLFRDIPFIIGVTKDEGLIMTMPYKDTMDELLDNLELYIPYLLEYTQLCTNTSTFVNAVTDFYFKSNDTKILWQNIVQATGDSLIVWPAYKTVNYQSTVMNSSIYFYMFGYEGTFSNTYSFDTTIYYGVAHADELNYFFPTLNEKFKDLMFHNTESDEAIINIMTEMWSNFAINGVPSAWRVPEWPDYKDSHEFLQIGMHRDTEMVVQRDFFPERMTFWDEITINFSMLEVEPSIEVNKPNISTSNDYNKFLMCLLLFVIVCLRNT